ncbi:hypothetical protein SPHV1_2250056 [Novosphingobium sp. KN65.2]|nr:hypothetical protein SPHV1_2250056 [Novosphingobium sp. KN65.2]
MSIADRSHLDLLFPAGFSRLEFRQSLRLWETGTCDQSLLAARGLHAGMQPVAMRAKLCSLFNNGCENALL